MTTTVSACLITRNEEQNIGRCLASITGVVDGIVICDTGSTDQTRDIARVYGASIVEGAWRDNFASARNCSINAACGDWIFWLDADEELVEEHPGAFRSLVAQLPHWGCLLDVRDVKDTEVQARRWNIFPNRAGIRFKGRVHEQPHPWPTDGQPAATDMVYILHHGYAAGPDAMNAKAERNMHLLALALRDETDPFMRLTYTTDLGRMQWFQGEVDACASTMRLAAVRWVELGRPPWQNCHVPYMLWAAAALKMGAYGVVEGVWRECPPEAMSAELLCCAGDAFIARKLYGLAAECFRRAVTDPAVIHPTLHERDKSTTYPLHRLGQLDVLTHAM